MTLKTGVMGAENSAFVITGINCKDILNCNKYYCFYCIFDQINAVLVSIRDSLKHCKLKLFHEYTIGFLYLEVLQKVVPPKEPKWCFEYLKMIMKSHYKF